METKNVVNGLRFVGARRMLGS